MAEPNAERPLEDEDTEPLTPITARDIYAYLLAYDRTIAQLIIRHKLAIKRAHEALDEAVAILDSRQHTYHAMMSYLAKEGHLTRPMHASEHGQTDKEERVEDPFAAEDYRWSPS